jgi:CcmD family protein
MSFRPLMTAVTAFVLLAPSLWAMQPPPGQSEFVPINELPPGDQLPAAPLLIGAYAFIWLAVMFYLWSIWRRLNQVETEMHALAQKKPGR